MEKKEHSREDVSPALDYRPIAKPLTSSIVYSALAIIILFFLVLDLVKLATIYLTDPSKEWFHEPSLEQLLLSVFGAALSMWSDLDVREIFNLNKNEAHGQEHIQLFGYLLCVLPIIIGIVSSIFKNTSKLSKFIGVSSKLFCDAHNAFMVLYSIFIIVLLADIAYYFARRSLRGLKQTIR